MIPARQSPQSKENGVIIIIFFLHVAKLTLPYTPGYQSSHRKVGTKLCILGMRVSCLTHRFSLKAAERATEEVFSVQLGCSVLSVRSLGLPSMTAAFAFMGPSSHKNNLYFYYSVIRIIKLVLLYPLFPSFFEVTFHFVLEISLVIHM